MNAEHPAAYVGRADLSIETARAELESMNLRVAAEHAFEAFRFLAQACLERDGLSDAQHDGVVHEYGHRFGGGGRLYAAYYRWMLDAGDLVRAYELELRGLAGAEGEDSTLADTIDRAQTFRDAVERFLEKPR